MDSEGEADHILHDAVLMTNREFSNDAISTTSRAFPGGRLGRICILPVRTAVRHTDHLVNHHALSLIVIIMFGRICSRICSWVILPVSIVKLQNKLTNEATSHGTSIISVPNPLVKVIFERVSFSLSASQSGS